MQNKNIKSLEANLEFLKKFQGKKSVITKQGLISSLNSQLKKKLSSKKATVNDSLNQESIRQEKSLIKTKKKGNTVKCNTSLSQVQTSQSMSKLSPMLSHNKSERQIKSERFLPIISRREPYLLKESCSNSKNQKKSVMLPKLNHSKSVKQTQKIIENAQRRKKSHRSNSTFVMNSYLKKQTGLYQFLEELQNFQKSVAKMKTYRQAK